MADPVEVYLVRHAIAADRGDDFPDDSKRPLTSQGISRFKKEAKALDAMGVSIAVVLTSPLARARQTADILAQTLKTGPQVVTSDALTPAGTLSSIASRP